MEQERNDGDIGWSETPPRGAHGRDNPRRENSPYPPADRPVYSVPPEEKKGGGFSGGFNFTVLFVVAIILLAMAGIYLYQPSFTGGAHVAAQKTGEVNTSQPAAPSAAGDNRALKAELARTVSILQQLESRAAGDEARLKKIMELKKEARELLSSLE